MPLPPRFRRAAGEFQQARLSAYGSEKVLEDLVRNEPWQVLPWEDFGGDQPLPPLVVGQQVALGSSGVADLVAVSEDGYLTVLECKLDRNQEVRRAVVGQILGYAAYLRRLPVADFEESVVRPFFDRHSDLRGLRFAEGVGRLRARARGDADSALDWSEEQFLAGFEANRRSGRMRLLIVVDSLNEELRDIVDFLADMTAGRLQVIGCGLSLFAGPDGTQILVPEISGARAEAGRPSVASGLPLDEASYQTQVASEGGRALLELLRDLESSRREAGDYLRWNPKSLVYRAQLPTGETTILWAEPNDVAVPVARLKELVPAGAQLEQRLAAIAPFAPAIQSGKREAWVVYRKHKFSRSDAEQLVDALRIFLTAATS